MFDVKALKNWARLVGPGIAMTASGVGVGDLVAASIAGSKFGLALLWTVAAGVVLKFCLSEGLARWQLATGTTFLEGWVKCFGKWIRYYFVSYLAIWTIVVGAALMSACGMAAHALLPTLSVPVWGIVHAFLALALTLSENYLAFERTAKIFVALMFLTLIGTSLVLLPVALPIGSELSIFSFPPGSTRSVLSVLGGIGGSVSLLYYGYWMKERGWNGIEDRKAVSIDLCVCYCLTGLFGAALMLLASALFYNTKIPLNEENWVRQMALLLKSQIGPSGYWIFLVGFWATVTSAMLGTWRGLPYLVCDFISQVRKENHRATFEVGSSSVWFRGALCCLVLLPIPLLFLPAGRPIVLIVLFTIIGSLFIPILAGSLLVMNSRWIEKSSQSKPLTNAILILSILFFAALAVQEIKDLVRLH